ncbi:hypothetical protein LJC24_05290 [Desulfococcaceae bacterium OttesenSCG-928-F15]|nr:hypothetical protein [Desulfococcaceae bacterium OttesenSCG-928-F15]
MKDLLVGGLGKGGRGYYGMVLQNNARWAKEKSLSESALVSDLDIWEFPPPTKRAMEKDMGYSYSKVALVRSNLSKHPWIAVFGNGYDSPSEKAVLIILDAFTGEEIRRIPTGEERDNGLSSPALVDTDRDGKADWVYAGDLKGNLWKFDISSTQAEDWHVFFQKGPTEKPLFTCEGPGGAPQAITAKPAIARHCSGLGYMVLWGTGQHLGLPDLENFSVQTLYGVWDYGDKTANLGVLDRKENSGYLHGLDSGSFGPSLHLVRQTIEAASFSTENALEGEVGDNVSYPVASHTKNPQTYTWEEKGKSLKDGSTVGWFFDFPEKGERMTEDALIHESAVFATSFVPACIASPCTAGGHSWINALDLCSGQRLPRIFFDINMNKTLEGAQMSQENTDPGDALVVSGTSYEVSRLKIPATAFLIGIFSGSGFEYLLMLDLHGERMLPMEINKAADKIFYWRMR